MLHVQNLSFSYEGNPLFENLSCRFEAGSSTAILGPSGSGKSTLFRLFSGLLTPHHGKVLLQGGRYFHLVTYMMQQDLLLPWKSTRQNVEMLAKLSKRQYESQEVEDLLREVDLLQASHLYPRQLSVGMRQRASLARALLVRRPFLFLDEPFSSVDPSQRRQLCDLVASLQRERGFTLLLITHDPEEAYRLCKRVLVLQDGELRERG